MRVDYVDVAGTSPWYGEAAVLVPRRNPDDQLDASTPSAGAVGGEHWACALWPATAALTARCLGGEREPSADEPFCGANSSHWEHLHAPMSRTGKEKGSTGTSRRDGQKTSHPLLPGTGGRVALTGMTGPSSRDAEWMQIDLSRKGETGAVSTPSLRRRMAFADGQTGVLVGLDPLAEKQQSPDRGCQLRSWEPDEESSDQRCSSQSLCPLVSFGAPSA